MGQKRRHLFTATIALAVFAIVGAACSTSDGSGDASPSGATSTSTSESSSAAPEPASLVVELDWVPNPDHVGLYYAQEKGYFDDAGLTIEFRPPSNAADPIKLVGLNKVDLAITYQPEMSCAN